MANFGVVQNEHLRQDIGGVLSWEQNIGPRNSGTVYVRSHEYGVQQRIEGFNPATTKLSFLYFGTRERLSVTDTTEGLLISTLPANKSILLVRDVILGYLSGLKLADTLGAQAKESVRTEMLKKLEEQLGGRKIKRMFFTEWVVQ
jgi:hypothetical protein